LYDLKPSSEAVIPGQRRKESWKAVSESCCRWQAAVTNQPFRATCSLAGSTNERDTYVRHSSIMLKRRIALAGVPVQSGHLYGNGVSILPNVCL